MLWASEATGKDGRPAVLLLAARRTLRGVQAEIAYVAMSLPAGPLPGTFYREEHVMDRVTLVWPDGWPEVKLQNRVHPAAHTPAAAVSQSGHIYLEEFQDDEENSSNENE